MSFSDIFCWLLLLFGNLYRLIFFLVKGYWFLSVLFHLDGYIFLERRLVGMDCVYLFVSQQNNAE